MSADKTAHERRVEAWAQDPEGKALVQAILDRKERTK